MQYGSLGRSGLKVSRLCLGAMSFGKSAQRPWALDERDARALMRRALELGVNFFDTADYYSHGLSEEILGGAVRALTHRHEVVVATKAWAPMSLDPNGRGLSRKHLFDAVDASLRRLQTDHIDLFQIHRWDPVTPIEESLDALDDIVRSGRVRYVGASSMSAWQFMKAIGLQRQNGWATFVSMQNHYNLIYREEEREMIPLCQSEGVGILPWSPLARGFLAKSPESSSRPTQRQTSDGLLQSFYGSPQDQAIRARVFDIAHELDRPPSDIAMAWLWRKPALSALVVGPRSCEQLESLHASMNVTLSDDHVRRLEELYGPRTLVGIDPPENVEHRLTVLPN